MMHDADTPVTRRQCIQNLAGAVAAAVIDDNHFEIGGHDAERIHHFRDSVSDEALFIPSWQHDGYSVPGQWRWSPCVYLFAHAHTWAFEGLIHRGLLDYVAI